VSKRRRQFICRNCGAVQPKWMGKCPDCGEWDALEEHTVTGLSEDLHRPVLPGAEAEPVPLDQPVGEGTDRLVSGIAEFDRIVGGGLVIGSSVLIGGDPGIGKSTLLLQVADALAGAGHAVLYVTSEESIRQIQQRARRIGAKAGGVAVLAQTNLEVISHQILNRRPAAIVIDSIQMVYAPTVPAAPGSVRQLRDCGTKLVWLAKNLGCVMLLVGHVTKQGQIAGPRLIEHIADCVIYFEGDRFHTHRLLRAVKNRYGSTNEVGIFEMTDRGLRPVGDPSRLFLSGMDEPRPGSVVAAACEGTRVLIVEIQGLCVQSVLGAAKRKVSGVDASRVAMVLAVLEKHAGLVLADQDVFVNVVGGVRVIEPAADLPIALAVAGALTGRKLPERTLAIGEIGLGGELRPVHTGEQRLIEAKRLGFERAIAPASQATETGVRLHACRYIQQAMDLLV